MHYRLVTHQPHLTPSIKFQLTDFVLIRLQLCGQHERAAAVALFNNKIQEAIDILRSQKTQNNTETRG